MKASKRRWIGTLPIRHGSSTLGAASIENGLTPIMGREAESATKNMHITIDARMVHSSGIGRYTRSVVKALQEKEFRQTLLLPSSRERELLHVGNTETRSFSIHPYNPLEQFLLPLVIPPSDIFFSPHITTTALPLRARRRVVTIHDAFHISNIARFGLVKRSYARFLYRSALATADTVIAVSEFTRSELAHHFPRYTGKIKVVPNALDLSVFYRDPVQPELQKPYALFVGNLKPHKNLMTAVQALGLQGDPDLALAIAGASSGFLHGMGNELETLKRNPRLIFLGNQDDIALRRLYSHGECLVLPSFYEGFGYPALEAMACGMPVICSSIPPLKETCGDAALFCNPESPGAFAKAIEAVRSNSVLRSRLIRAGLERVRLFSPDRFKAETLAALVGDML